MANMLDRNTFEHLPVADYQEIRGQLSSGDLIFCSGEYLMSKAIRCVTHSYWSHVGIVFRFGSIDRVLLLESVEDAGVRFAPLSKYLSDYQDGRPYQGHIAIARVDGLAPGQLKFLAKSGLDLLTQPWGWAIAVYILFRLFFNRLRRPESRSFLCSELVARCFAAAGITFRAGKKRYVSPGDIWENARVRLLWRIL